MIAVIDIETTGLDYFRNEILVLSIGLYGNKTLIAEKEFKFRPTRLAYWSDEAESIHEISKEEALSFPQSTESWTDFFDFCREWIHPFDKAKFICHAKWFGHYFDRMFIECQTFLNNQNFEFRKYFGETMSTLTLCQQLKNNQVYNFEEFNLAYLAKFFNIALDHHNAKSDREACAKIYHQIYREIGDENYPNKEKKITRKTTSRKASKNKETTLLGAVPVGVH